MYKRMTIILGAEMCDFTNCNLSGVHEEENTITVWCEVTPNNLLNLTGNSWPFIKNGDKQYVFDVPFEVITSAD